MPKLDKPDDIHTCVSIDTVVKHVQQWYTVAMYELHLDPAIISAIVKRVEELKNE